MPPTDVELATCLVTAFDYSEEEEYDKLIAIQWHKLRLLWNKGTGSTRSLGTQRLASTISSVMNLMAVLNDIASEINDMQINNGGDTPRNHGHLLLDPQNDAKLSRT